MMHLNFDMETPETCADCNFHFTDKKYDDYTWAMYCMICPDVEETIQDGMTKRSAKCIGVVDDD